MNYNLTLVPLNMMVCFWELSCVCVVNMKFNRCRLQKFSKIAFPGIVTADVLTL